MNIQLVTPAPLRLNNGNKITALRWSALLKKLGHRVRVTQSYDERRCDLLIALHARRSAASVGPPTQIGGRGCCSGAGVSRVPSAR